MGMQISRRQLTCELLEESVQFAWWLSELESIWILICCTGTHVDLVMREIPFLLNCRYNTEPYFVCLFLKIGTVKAKVKWQTCVYLVVYLVINHFLVDVSDGGQGREWYYNCTCTCIAMVLFCFRYLLEVQNCRKQ